MPILSLADYRPDIVDLDTQASNNLTNCVPRGDGYGPFGDLIPFTAALPSPCRGYFYARNVDGSIAVFAATSTRLYQLNNTNFTWTDVSLGGSAYSALSANANWQFAQFNTLVFATQANVVLQVFTLGSSTAFANNAGSPPQAAYITIVGRFVVLSGLLSNPTRVQWSGLDATTTWDNVTNQSNFQDLPDGGTVRGVAGGDQYGVVFQDARIRTMTFAPGSPEIFDILAFPSVDGIYAPQSIINANNGTFFLSPQGFKFIAPGGVPSPIGRERIDRTFFANVDSGNLQLLFGASDPASTRVYWAYKSIAGIAGQFDTLLCYDWALDRFTQVKVPGTFLASLAKPGITLENLDAIASGVLAITAAANNGSGAIRLTLSSEVASWTYGQADTTHSAGQAGTTNLGNASQNTIEVYGVTGTTEANGNWRFTVHDSTHIDLVGSTFTNAYISGGSVGGAVDALTFSLDSISNAAFAQLSAVTPSAEVGFFTGPALEAQMETPEQDGQGRRIFINGVRLLTDASAAMCSIAARDNAQATSVYGAESAVNAVGIAPQRIDTRYARAKVRIPYGSTWTYCMGVEPMFRTTGVR